MSTAWTISKETSRIKRRREKNRKETIRREVTQQVHRYIKQLNSGQRKDIETLQLAYKKTCTRTSNIQQLLTRCGIHNECSLGRQLLVFVMLPFQYHFVITSILLESYHVTYGHTAVVIIATTMATQQARLP